MSSLQDLKMVMRIQVKSNEESQAPGLSQSDPKKPSVAENPPAPENHHSTGSKQTQMQRLVTQNSICTGSKTPCGLGLLLRSDISTKGSPELGVHRRGVAWEGQSFRGWCEPAHSMQVTMDNSCRMLLELL